MTLSPHTLRIGGALVVALLLVGASYVLSGPSFLSSRIVGAESTDELLTAYAAKDSDNDGLPDWQESLYGTNPSKPDTDEDGVSDGDAAKQGLLSTQKLLTDRTAEPISAEDIPGVSAKPGTMTDDFSKIFFERYMSSWSGQPLTDKEQQDLLSTLLGEFSEMARKKLESPYTAASVHVSNDVSVLSYAASVESIILSNNVKRGEENPIDLAQAFIEEEDGSAKAKLSRLSSAYRGIANGLLAAYVPPSLAEEHLLLLRSFDTLARATASVGAYDEDPLAVLGALALLQPVASDSVQAFTDISTEILKTGEPAKGTPGALLVNIARSAQSI